MESANGEGCSVSLWSVKKTSSACVRTAEAAQFAVDSKSFRCRHNRSVMGDENLCRIFTKFLQQTPHVFYGV
jgi:hypothetical protein